MKNTKTYSSVLAVERSGQTERSGVGPTAVGIGHPNPEVVAKPKRRIFTGEYKQRVLGSNYRITEFQAAILLQQLARLEEQNSCRSRNAYSRGLRRNRRTALRFHRSAIIE